MNQYLETILERPLSHRLGILFGLLGAIGFVFWMYLYKPKLSELNALKEKQVELQTKITNEKRLAANLAKFRAEVKDLDIKLNIALQELPDKREIPDLLTSISNLARDAGLEVALFKTEPESFQEFYSEVPASILVSGTYHQVATFFDEVGRLSRVVNIKEIQLTEPKVVDGEATLKISCVATTFRYLDEQERAERGGQDTEGKRR